MHEQYADGSYLQAHPGWHAPRAPWKADHVVRGLRAAGVQPTSVIDVGCGTGSVLVELTTRLSLQAAVGYDPSPNAPIDDRADGCSPTVEIRRGSVDDIADRFDVALALDVFEHLDDYIGFLWKIGRVAPVTVFHVPLEINALSVLLGRLGESRGLHGHLHHFSRRTALDAIEAAGYEVLHHHFSTTWPGPGRNPRSPINLLRRFVYRLSPSLAERSVGGMALLVVARHQPGAVAG